jgi:hypothetical protein
VVQKAGLIALADCGYRVIVLPRIVREGIQLRIEIAGGWEDPPELEPQGTAHPARGTDPIRWKITNTIKTTVVVPKGQTVVLTTLQARFRSMQGDPWTILITPRVVDVPPEPGCQLTEEQPR